MGYTLGQQAVLGMTKCESYGTGPHLSRSAESMMIQCTDGLSESFSFVEFPELSWCSSSSDAWKVSQADLVSLWCSAIVRGFLLPVSGVTPMNQGTLYTQPNFKMFI
jgi:hypothetical protein